MPFSDTVAARVSVQSQNRDDRVHNPRPTGTRDLEGYNDNAGRVQLLIQPNKQFSALFNLHARDLDNNATLFRANIIKQGTNELVDGFDYGSYPTDGVNKQTLKTKGASMRLRWNLDGVTLHSITGYESADFYSRADVDGGFGAVYAQPMGPGYIPFVVETADLLPSHKQTTQEFRAESNVAGLCNGSAACSTSRNTSRSTASVSILWRRATRKIRSTPPRPRTPVPGRRSARRTTPCRTS